mmetsp:Transcript_121470/g.170867  ORF Transcript_121470/g.170867 Transcript_121470/m.170867 type:complete len:148 (-) Transcript_121470:115-558(-)
MISLRRMFVVMLLAAVAAANDVQEVSKEFQAKPGSGTTVVDITNSENTKCTFKFACNGGTGETWLLLLKGDVCTVANLSGDGVSYLYFEFVSLSIEGPHNHQILSTFADPAQPNEFETTEFASESSADFSHSIHEFGIEYGAPHEEL